MRTIINLNTDWQFSKQNTEIPETKPMNWERVDLPHTWNRDDGQNGQAQYHRGSCWYANSFTTPKQRLGGPGRVFVDVPAANSVATVYVNGKEAAHHEGGYSRFRADITDLCTDDGNNVIAIEVDNSHNSAVYPQTADFSFYGGLYRGLNLI